MERRALLNNVGNTEKTFVFVGGFLHLIIFTTLIGSMEQVETSLDQPLISLVRCLSVGSDLVKVDCR